VISPGARRLYQRLLALGPAGIHEIAGDRREEDPRVAELTAIGLVRDVNGTLMAIPPRVARSEVSRSASRRSRELLQSAIDVEAFLDRCVAVDDTPTDRNRAAEIISGESEVSLLSYAVPAAARHEVCSVQTARFREAWRTRRAVFDPSFTGRREISYRVVYAQACFDDPFLRQTIEDSAKQGEESRVHPAPPLKFKVMDGHTVLVPVDDTGAAGVLLIRSTAVAALFTDYFERLWAESASPEQLESTGSDLLKPLELRILGMLADDTSDATIAARLRISERSLRRHISGVLSKLGAQTRAGALAAAIRRGMVV
jgi:DNA-binding CsgD family transcriptional regulator